MKSEFIKKADEILRFASASSFLAIAAEITGTIAVQKVALIASGRWVTVSAF